MNYTEKSEQIIKKGEVFFGPNKLPYKRVYFGQNSLRSLLKIHLHQFRVFCKYAHVHSMFTLTTKVYEILLSGFGRVAMTNYI